MSTGVFFVVGAAMAVLFVAAVVGVVVLNRADTRRLDPVAPPPPHPPQLPAQQAPQWGRGG